MQQNIDDAFGHWFAGFVDGEGNFDIHAIHNTRRTFICRFSIGLRIDDHDILAEIQRRTGLGDIRIHCPPQGGPRGRTGDQARWTVARKRETAALVEIFNRYPLRAKKRHDFEVWARAVSVWLEVRNKRRHDWSELAALQQELREGRRLMPMTIPKHERTQLKLIA